MSANCSHYISLIYWQMVEIVITDGLSGQVDTWHLWTDCKSLITVKVKTAPDFHRIQAEMNCFSFQYALDITLFWAL